MANVLVTGGYGFIGTHLVSTLLAQGNNVTVFDLAKNTRDTSIDFENHDKYNFIQGDVTDADAVSAAIGENIDTVYHLSAVVGIRNYVNNPLSVLDVNVGGTRNVLEVSRRTGCRVVLASTSEVFGKNPNPPFAEDDDRVLGSTNTARWSYSTSKAMAEHVAFAMHDSLGIPVTIVRFFNVYGPRQNPIFVVSKGVHRVLNGRRPHLYDSGLQTRCFTYVDDAVEGTIMAGESDAAIGQAFNIGSMVESTMKDVVDKILEHAGVADTMTPEPIDTTKLYGSKYEDIPHRIPNTAKANEVLGWKLSTSVDEGIRRTIEWARENPWYLAEDPDA